MRAGGESGDWQRLRSAVVREAREWCRGRAWWWRAPLLLWLGWILVNQLRDPEYTSLFGGLNLGLHELGHILLAPLGRFLSTLGGSVVQCLAPLLGVAMFVRQRDWFGIAVALGWLSTNLFSVASYVGDARARQLPLVSPFGGEPGHDWNYLLDTLGLLPLDGALAFVLRLAATAVMLCGVAWGGWLVACMWRTR